MMAKRRYFESFVSSTETEAKVKLRDIVATELERTNGIVLYALTPLDGG